MKKYLLWIASLGLTGCTATPQSTYAPPMISQAAYKLSPQESSIVDDGVRRSLKDPGSAIFGTRYASKAAGGEVYVCGYVNAKNSFGGYVGDQIFYGMLAYLDGKPAAFGTIAVTSTAIDVTVARQMCSSWAILI